MGWSVSRVMWLMPTEHERSANYEFRLLRREEEEGRGGIYKLNSRCVR
jgi:hypothetical protein